MFAAWLGYRNAAFCLAKDGKDLRFAESARLHQNLLDHIARENSTFEAHYLVGDYQWYQSWGSSCPPRAMSLIQIIMGLLFLEPRRSSEHSRPKLLRVVVTRAPPEPPSLRSGY